MNDTAERKLALSHMGIAFGAFLIASFMGAYQVLERSGLLPAIQSSRVYFASLSSHGVLMAYVLTIFFVPGFGYYIAATCLHRSVWNIKLAWTGFGISLLGTVLAAIPLLTGRASVLYTFYPPIQADALFYIGATLLIAGSWVWCTIMIVMMTQWKQDNRGQPVPLAMFATAANAYLWLWTSIGVALEVLFQILPWVFGWRDTIDAGLARTLFAWTLHPIVYFWLIPAYTAFYVLVPTQAGSYILSDEMARVAFIVLVVFSLPIGFHHLYMDPEQAKGWKLLHGIGTFIVMLPTPWHILGLLGQPWRISSVQYNDPLTLAWDVFEFAMVIGGLIMLGSACLFVCNLVMTQLSATAQTYTGKVEFAEPIHPVTYLPELLNDFSLWNRVIAIAMIVSFGYPILQFFVMQTFDSSGWGY